VRFSWTAASSAEFGAKPFARGCTRTLSDAPALSAVLGAFGGVVRVGVSAIAASDMTTKAQTTATRENKLVVVPRRLILRRLFNWMTFVCMIENPANDLRARITPRRISTT
jgi:hypothetical protein